MKFIRRIELDPDAVVDQVFDKLEKRNLYLERSIRDAAKYNWTKKNLAAAHRSFYRSAEKELGYYIHVCILEITPREYVLFYGTKSDLANTEVGTGLFDSIGGATKWFMDGGR
jgi:hypothetical protein